jgi:hypothetical protein
MFRSCRAPSARCYRPCLEVLEDRNLLSTYLVDRLTDTGAGSGLSGDLRYCIGHATDGDAITFGVTGTINLARELPHLTHSISIEGPGASLLAIQGISPATLQVNPGSTVSISRVTIGPGDVGIENEGTLMVSECMLSGNSIGIRNDGLATVSNSTITDSNNGGIVNYGTFVLSNSNVVGNYRDGPEGGGGITNLGTLNITGSTIAYNYGFFAEASGISNFGRVMDQDVCILTISNSTIVGNGEDGDRTTAGAIFGGPVGSITIDNCTIAGNTGYFVGGIVVNAAPLSMGNTILAGNNGSSSGPDLYGSLSSSGHNLIGNSRGGSGYAATDLLNVDPVLGPLQDNGGPTQTMALLAGSPALNAGDSSQLGVADQRGVVRRGGVNIGAYQASASTFVLTAPDTATAGTPFDATVKAVDTFGQTAVGYTGTVLFSSSDGQAVLPSDFAFTSGDAGMHTFSGGVTLKTAGNQTVTATDTATASLTASASVTVNPAAADHLLFLQQPTDTTAGQTLSPVMVAVVDAFGNVETGDDSDTITLSLGTNPGGGTLGGTLTVTVSGGIATFSDLAIDVVGDGYTLHASIGAALQDSESDPLNVTM